MFKVVISVKPPEVKTIRPYRLIEPMTKDIKQLRMDDINNNFQAVQRWLNVRRNYSS
jgi:hypothetical protein